MPRSAGQGRRRTVSATKKRKVKVASGSKFSVDTLVAKKSVRSNSSFTMVLSGHERRAGFYAEVLQWKDEIDVLSSLLAKRRAKLLLKRYTPDEPRAVLMWEISVLKRAIAKKTGKLPEPKDRKIQRTKAAKVREKKERQKEIVEPDAEPNRETLASIVKEGLGNAARETMDVMGYNVVVKDGWVVKLFADGHHEKIKVASSVRKA